MNRLLASLLFAATLGAAAVATAEDPLPLSTPTSSLATITGKAEVKLMPEFNQIVLRIAREYPTDGTHDYWWPKNGESAYDGCTTDLFLDGQKVMEGEPGKRTYCCGFTLEVFLKAYNEFAAKHGDRMEKKLTPDVWEEFQKAWFVEQTNGPGPSAALVKFGLGREIKKDEAMPGDFVQIWRRWDPEKAKNGSGHSVIFIDWVRNESGTITGIKYLSTQPSTKGISETVELFAPAGEIKGVADEFTFYGRVEIPVKQ